MVRKLSLAIAMVLGVISFGAQALGLGDIHTKSALNQRLNADILLYSVGEAEIADINVRLASPEVFVKAGIDRPHFLSRLKFEPVLMPDGSGVIRVTSPDPVREPFLDFLIEVDWPNGQMLREYTVLLDPPVTTAQRPAPVQRPAAGVPAIQRETTAQPASASSTMSMTGGAGSSYGPTRRNETSWGIAKKIRHEGTSMEQMVMSLLYANPQAFAGNNVNNLRVGKILRIPSREEVMGLKYSDAHNAFRAQMNEWRADRASGAASAGGAQAIGQQMSGSAPKTGAAPMQPESELKIAPAESGSEEEAARSESGEPEKLSAQLQHDLIMANEATESAMEEGQELKSRVEDLESQLDDLQRLLTLKSEQLADMQGMVAVETPTVQPETPEPEMAQAETATAPETPVEPETAFPEETEAVQVPVEEELELELEETAGSQETVTTAATEEVSPATEPVLEPKPAVEAKPEPKPAVEAKPESKPVEKGMIEKFLGDTTLMGIAAGAVIVILVGLFWLVTSRRRRDRDEFQESILINTVDGKDHAEPMMETAQESVSHSQEETSFLSDFSPSDIDPLQGESGEVDSLAEADVYVAYGRYRQAEELIRQAMEREPERLELKAKLFEILYAIKDKDGFIELAEQSAGEGLPDSDPGIWSRVVSMGSKMAPSNALFTAGGEALDIQQESEAPSDGLGDIDDLDLDTLDTATDMTGSQEPQLEAGDFSLDGLEKELDANDGSVASEDEFNIDLGSDTKAETDDVFSLDVGTEEISEEIKEASSISQEADLDFGALDPEPTAESAEASEPAISEADLSMLDSLEQDGAKPEEEVISLDEDLSDLNLEDLEKELTAAGQEKGEGSKSGIAALELSEDDGEFNLDSIDQSLLDEVDTKLDLARAYVDMEDKDGARSILDEVLKEGNEEQKAVAEKMMVGLN